VAAIETAEEFGKRLYLEAWQRGWSRALVKVVMGDGSVWIWNGCGSFAFEAKARSVNWIAGVRRVHFVRMKGDISARMGYVDRRT